MAAVEGHPRATIKRQLWEGGGCRGGNKGRDDFSADVADEEVSKQRRGTVEAAVPAEESGVCEKALPELADKGGAE
jgi:hypothetical protein